MSETDAAGDDPTDWAIVAYLVEPRQARELVDLLAEAAIPCRLSFGGGAGMPQRGEDSAPPDTWVVAVPGEEEPVAHGVAERLLAWYRVHAEAEGEASDEEIAAALAASASADPEFAAALEHERRNRGRCVRRYAGLILAMVLLMAGVTGYWVWALLTGP